LGITGAAISAIISGQFLEYCAFSLYEKKAWSNHWLSARFVIAVYSNREMQVGFPLLSAHAMKLVYGANALAKSRESIPAGCIYTRGIF